MRRTLIAITFSLLALLLASCTLQMGYPEDLTDTGTVSTQAPTTTQQTTPVLQNTTTKKPVDSKPSTTTTAEDKPNPPVVTTEQKPDSTHPYKDETVVVKFPAEVANGGKTYTGLPPMADITFTVVDPLNKLGISTQKFSHSFGAAKNGKPHNITVENQKRFDQ